MSKDHLFNEIKKTFKENIIKDIKKKSNLKKQLNGPKKAYMYRGK
tara:strand:+ start:3105 stop:3239 length:135 start_codon:yes stop_codon:yes gene_type:complete